MWPTPTRIPTTSSSPAEQVAVQITAVESYVASGEIASQMQGPLVNKLQNAAQSLAAGQVNTAINQLNAYINQVNAQRGKKITIAAADDLIAQAQGIIASLIPTPTPTRTSTATPLAYQPGNLFLASFHTSRLAQDQSTPTLTPTATVTPGPTPLPGLEQTIIDYTYDPLNRLTDADYSTGVSYQYVYDAVGNRLSQQTTVLSLEPALNGSEGSTVSHSTYDDANRLSTVGSIAYSFDANGNLLNDGVNTYAYDSANRLISVNGGQSSVVSYGYNGLGDRLQQTVNGQPTTYVLDLNASLSQVLNDGTNTYLYGNGRISQTTGGNAQYFLDDALGSVRQTYILSGRFEKKMPPYLGASWLMTATFGAPGRNRTHNLLIRRNTMRCPCAIYGRLSCMYRHIWRMRWSIWAILHTCFFCVAPICTVCYRSGYPESQIFFAQNWARK